MHMRKKALTQMQLIILILIAVFVFVVFSVFMSIKERVLG